MSTPSLLALLQSHGWKGNIPVVPGEVETVAQRFGIARLPPDYQEVLTHSNGGSLYGFKTPLILFSVQEVLQLYREHDLYSHMAGSLIFGADGGGTLYAYDLRIHRESGAYQVFFVREDDSGYDKAIFRAPGLFSVAVRIIQGDKLN